MPYCTRCGRQSPDEARFCSNCGLALAAGGRVEPPQDDSTSTISLTAIAAMDERGPDVMSPVDVEAINQLPRDSALLVVRRGPNAGSRFLLDTEVTTAGRHPDSQIFLDDVTVSRGHAEFRRTPNGFVVRDMQSLNGTYVNRVAIEEALLSSGDEVQIGKYRMVFFPSPAGVQGSGYR